MVKELQMFTCCFNNQNLCEDFSCDVQKNDNGLVITFSSENKEKVEALHKMTEGAKTLCCPTDDKDKSSCC